MTDGGLVTMRPIASKNPAIMGPGVFITYAYTLEGDTLTICLGLVGSSRPSAFKTSAGSGHALERLRRVSPARPSNVTGGKRPTAKRPPEPSVPVDESQFVAVMTPLLQQLQGEWIPIELVTDGAPMDSKWLAFGGRTQSGNETIWS